MHDILFAGLVYSAVAILSKVLGCGLPAYLMNFNLRGALRVGAGMIPRGEVALIVAGIGLSSGVIGRDVFGIAVLMTVVTTLIAPPTLVRAFRGGKGVRHGAEAKDDTQTVSLDFGSGDMADFVIHRVARAFQAEGFFVHAISTEPLIYQIRKEDMAFSLSAEGALVRMAVSERFEHVARMVMYEELLSVREMIGRLRETKDPLLVGRDLVKGVFGPS